MRENCLQQFEAHWNCLELNNQVSLERATRNSRMFSTAAYKGISTL